MEQDHRNMYTSHLIWLIDVEQHVQLLYCVVIYDV